MRVAVTGGGTGGHIYPALEVAQELQRRGAEVVYFGSLRGPEGDPARAAGFGFFGYPALPLLSLRSLAGWRGLASQLRSVRLARNAMRRLGIERAFGTGGYGAAPAVAAARALGRPYVLHESNSIPGRANRAFARRARAVTCVFHRTLQEVPGAVRTGQPIRAALREAALLTKETGEHVLVTGGSQGAAFLNGIAPSAARIAGGEWLHATGAAHLESVVASGLPEGYRAAAYLESAEMAAAYRWARVAVGRSGGTLAEYALFRLPSVLVPLPSSADGHQLHNAEEFAAMGAATLLPQASATPEGLAEAVSFWLTSPDARDKAAAALADWDRPNATAEIAELVLK